MGGGGGFFFCFCLCRGDITGKGQILDLTIKVKAYVQKKKYTRNNKMHRRFASTPQNEEKVGKEGEKA